MLSHRGYVFELDDQLQYLLLPYRSIYPHFAQGDWFTWHTSHYHLTYAWLVRGLHALSGEARFPQAMFVAHALCLTWLCFSIDRLSRACRAGWLGTLVCLLAIAWVRDEAIAGATFNHGQLVPADLAMPPLLLAAQAWLGGRPAKAGLWLGLSGLLHANFAVLGPLLLGLSELLKRLATRPQARLGRAELRGLISYLVLASPSLWIIGVQFFAGDARPEAVDIVFRIRSPHHYELDGMPAVDLWWPLCLLAFGAPALIREARTGLRPLHFLHAATALWLLVGLVATLSAIGPLVRLFFWRLSPLWLLLLLNAGAAELRAGLGGDRRRRVGALVWFASVALSLCAFARSDMAEIAPLSLPRSLFGLPALLTILLADLALLRARSTSVWGVACGLAIAVHAISAPPHEHLRAGMLRKPVMGGPRLGRFIWDGTHEHVKNQALVAFVRAHTVPGDRFLIPPSFITFRIRTRRAVFVDFKAAPMRGEEAVEWQRRMLLAMGTDRFVTTGYPLRYRSGELYEARPLAELAALARREGMNYVVARRKRGAARAGLSRVTTDGDYALYRVRPPDPT